MITEPVRDIFPVIERNFATDKDLLDHWHIQAPCNAKDATRRTIEDLKETQKDFKFYRLIEGSDEVGFFGTESFKGIKFLTSFFIRPEFRHEEVFEKFFEQIREKMNGTTYYTGVYEKNLRAVKFLRKYSEDPVMNEIDSNGNRYVVFQLN